MHGVGNDEQFFVVAFKFCERVATEVARVRLFAKLKGDNKEYI